VSPERLYERFGARVWWCVLILPVCLALPMSPTIVAIASRYLGIKVHV
jgi:hypothetical protein